MPMNVLVVDNLTSHIQTLARGLRTKGYRVFPATNALEALSILWGDAPSIDLIITDDATVLPDSDALIRRIRSGDRRLPMIMMTAGKAYVHNVNPLCALCTAFLEKPFELETLLQAVEDCLKACPIRDPGPSG